MNQTFQGESGCKGIKIELPWNPQKLLMPKSQDHLQHQYKDRPVRIATLLLSLV